MCPSPSSKLSPAPSLISMSAAGDHHRFSTAASIRSLPASIPTPLPEPAPGMSPEQVLADLPTSSLLLSAAAAAAAATTTATHHDDDDDDDDEPPRGRSPIRIPSPVPYPARYPNASDASIRVITSRQHIRDESTDCGGCRRYSRSPRPLSRSPRPRSRSPRPRLRTPSPDFLARHGSIPSRYTPFETLRGTNRSPPPFIPPSRSPSRSRSRSPRRARRDCRRSSWVSPSPSPSRSRSQTPPPIIVPPPSHRPLIIQSPPPFPAQPPLIQPVSIPGCYWAPPPIMPSPSPPPPAPLSLAPDLLTYELEGSLAYVPAAPTYEEAIDHALHAFPSLTKLAAQDRSRITLSIVGCARVGETRVRVTAAAWSTVLKDLTKYEIVRVDVQPDLNAPPDYKEAAAVGSGSGTNKRRSWFARVFLGRK